MPQAELSTRIKVLATTLHDTFLIAVGLASIALIASLFMPDIPLRARQPRQQQPSFGEVPSSPEAAEPEAAVG